MGRCYKIWYLVHIILTQMLNAHRYAITALNFSDDGKMLATYAYGDSTLNIWLVSSPALYAVIPFVKT